VTPVPEFLTQSIGQNKVMSYLLALAAFGAGSVLVAVVKNFVLRRLRGWAASTSAELDDILIVAVERALLPLLYFGVFYFSIAPLHLHEKLLRVVGYAWAVLIALSAARFVVLLLNHLLVSYWSRKESDPVREQQVKGLMPFIKVLVWGLAAVFLLDNLGYKVSTVIAGLGIGGVAVALAAQAVLGDLFSYFAILFDRPFAVGDFIIVGDFLGTIEHIGIKTTRLRSLSGEQVVMSNSDLTGSRVRNYKRMERRRVAFTVGVTYETPTAKLREVPEVLRSAVEKAGDTAFDRAHFSAYADFSLNFETVYFVLSADYNRYMDVQQAINFAIKDEFEKRGIEFAYPTQTLILRKT
jgi:small-conductance mechanosensitive channel